MDERQRILKDYKIEGIFIKLIINYISQYRYSLLFFLFLHIYLIIKKNHIIIYNNNIHIYIYSLLLKKCFPSQPIQQQTITIKNITTLQKLNNSNNKIIIQINTINIQYYHIH